MFWLNARRYAVYLEETNRVFGECRIRTYGTRKGTLVFKTSTINRSVNSPCYSGTLYFLYYTIFCLFFHSRSDYPIRLSYYAFVFAAQKTLPFLASSGQTPLLKIIFSAILTNKGGFWGFPWGPPLLFKFRNVHGIL